ncbi:MAG: Rho termination factor N-terminal domain-containing protein [Nostoc sp.]
MQSLLTASVLIIAAAYALLVTVQFILGAFILWQRSQPATVPTVPTVEPEATIPMIHPVIEPKVKLEVVTLPTAEPELLATFAPELVSPMPKEAMATPAARIATSAAFLAPVQALEVLTIRELKRMASASGVRNYSSMRKGQLIEQILSKQLLAV